MSWTAVAGVLNLADVLELVVDRFDQRAFPQQNLLLLIHELVLHVFPYIGDQFQAACVELVEEIFADVTFVAKEFAPQIVYQKSWAESYRRLRI